MRISKNKDAVMIKEASQILGVTENTLRNWEKAGKIKVFRHPLNNYRLYWKKDLEDILDKIENTDNKDSCAEVGKDKFPLKYIEKFWEY